MSGSARQQPISSDVEARLTAADLVADRALTKTDRDDFDYAAIANRLGDLALAAETPTNVALFGPWGSGKSSIYELLRRALDNSPSSRVKLVRYDAWKYGGESLRRNFISHAATELGFHELNSSGRADPENRRFHRGLYEKQRRADVDFRDFDISNAAPLALFAAVFIGLVLAFALLVGAASLLTEEDFFGEIARTLPEFLVSTGVVAALVAGAKVVLDGARVEVEQSQPGAEEEFAKTFVELLRRARDEKGYDRFVFFVDELDRCSSEDVVKTLTAIKTFLDQESCVFVVAADREVLERALEELPQSTPLDEENPYYSSASAFFDKVFQHQLPLPPLRGRRLTRFARDLAAERGGLWGQMRDAEAGGQMLDRVIYALVPSHVRSPRRVKALLNTFATNVRVAESRGVDWRGRAAEIAKLTVLQTEFPRLAADLQHEPRLPALLLAEPRSPSRRVSSLLERHGGSASSSGVSSSSLDKADSPDPTLLVEDEDVERLKETQHALLRRYLERTSDISDPGRDLLYLEAAGAAFGLEDAALGELIETDAPEAPDRVVQAVVEREPEERLQAVRVLADMCDQEFGPERKNVMTALMGGAAAIGDRIPEVGDVVVAALRSFQEEQLLADEHLVGALRVALATETGDVRSLTEAMFARAELLSTTQRLTAVARMLRDVPSRFRDKVHERLAEAFADDRSALMDALADLDDDTALAVLDAAPIKRVLEDALEGAEGVVVGDELYVAAQDSQPLAEAVQRQLLFHREAYPSVRRHAEEVLDRIADSGEVDDHALLALDWAPPEDWDLWSSRLSDGRGATERQGTWAVYAATGMLRKLASEVDEAERAAAVLTKLLPFLGLASAENAKKLIAAVEELLAGQMWWSSEDLRKRQQELHRVIRALLDVPSGGIAPAVVSRLVADLTRAKEAVVAARPGVPQRSAATETQTLLGLRLMGSMLPGESAAELYEEWKTVTPPADETDAHRLTHALVTLAATAGDGGSQVDLSPLDTDRVGNAVTASYRPRHDLLAQWLRLSLAATDVARILAGAAPTSRDARDAVSNYAERIGEGERTALVGAVLDSSSEPAWVEVLAQHGVDDDALTERLASEVEAAATVDERDRSVRLLVALRPGTPRAQRRVADLVIHLLGTGVKGDFNVALRAIDALGTQHRSAERLREAFKSAANDSGFQVPQRAVEGLARARVRLPKKSLTDSARSALKKLLP